MLWLLLLFEGESVPSLPPSSGGGTAVITPILTARLRKIER